MNREVYETLLARYGKPWRRPRNVLELPLEERAEIALSAAVEKVMLNMRTKGCQSTSGVKAK